MGCSLWNRHGGSRWPLLSTFACSWEVLAPGITGTRLGSACCELGAVPDECPGPPVGPLPLSAPSQSEDRSRAACSSTQNHPKPLSPFFSGSYLGRDRTGGCMRQTTTAMPPPQPSSSSHSPARPAPVGSHTQGGSTGTLCPWDPGVLVPKGGCWHGRDRYLRCYHRAAGPLPCPGGEEAEQSLHRADLYPRCAQTWRLSTNPAGAPQGGGSLGPTATLWVFFVCGCSRPGAASGLSVSHRGWSLPSALS